MSLLSIINLKKSYYLGPEKIEVLKGINLEVSFGEKIAILGPSGSGKTTILNLISLLDKPDSGEILFKGKRLLEFSEEEISSYRLHEVGYIFQFFHLLPELTVWENLVLPGLLARLEVEKIKERATELLNKLGLQEKAKVKPFFLSGGERQRVAIGRAIFLKPSLILADEPTGNLDQANAETVINYLFTLCHDEGSALILVTHNIDLAKRCQKRYLLKEGHLVEC